MMVNLFYAKIAVFNVYHAVIAKIIACLVGEIEELGIMELPFQIAIAKMVKKIFKIL